MRQITPKHLLVSIDNVIRNLINKFLFNFSIYYVTICEIHLRLVFDNKSS
jgi:hypothetical protein